VLVSADLLDGRHGGDSPNLAQQVHMNRLFAEWLWRAAVLCVFEWIG
jgi:hypothetical protein